MKTFLPAIVLAVALCVTISANGFAQQAAGDAPATKEDIDQYLEVAHVRENMQKMSDAVAGSMQQMIHEQFLKSQGQLPPDFEAKLQKELTDYMKALPFDQMVAAIEPIYEKHFTKQDVQALIAFYGSDTGQKILREMPAVTAETMQSVMPIIQGQMAAFQKRVQQDVADAIKETQSKPAN